MLLGLKNFPWGYRKFIYYFDEIKIMRTNKSLQNELLLPGSFFPAKITHEHSFRWKMEFDFVRQILFKVTC